MDCRTHPAAENTIHMYAEDLPDPRGRSLSSSKSIQNFEDVLDIIRESIREFRTTVDPGADPGSRKAHFGLRGSSVRTIN